MPFTLEKVYRSDGKDLATTTSSGVAAQFTEAAFDGRYLWMTRPVGNQVSGAIDVLEYFGERTDHEPTADELDNLRYARYESGAYRKLRCVAKLGATATTSTQITSVRSLCEFPQYFDMGVGSYTEGTATVTVGLSNLYIGVGNEEKVVTVSRPRVDADPTNLNPWHIQYSNGKMYVTSGLTTWKNVFVFDCTSMKFEKEIKFAGQMTGLPTDFSYPPTMSSVLATESTSIGRVTTALSGRDVTFARAVATTHVDLGTADPAYLPSNTVFPWTAGITPIDPVTTITTGLIGILLTNQNDPSQNGYWSLDSSFSRIIRSATNPNPVDSATTTGLIIVDRGVSNALNGVWYIDKSNKPIQSSTYAGVFGAGFSTQCISGVVDGVPVATGSRILFHDKTGLASVMVSTQATISAVSQSSTYLPKLAHNAWTAATDFDSEAENTNTFIKVTSGVTKANSIWTRASSSVAWSAPNTTSNTDFNSNMIVAHEKIWAITKMAATNQNQYIGVYKLADNSVSSVAIPARPSSAKAWMAPGYNGHVYITNYNNFSVTKVDADANTIASVIRLNSSPTRVYTDSARRIWVSSYGGMLSLVDYDDDQVHNDYGSVDGIISFAADTSDASKLWWVDATNKLVRMDINTKQVLETESAANDWNIVSKELTSMKDHSAVFITPFVQYTRENGDVVTVRPYLFTGNVISASEGPLIAFRLDDTYFYRDAYCEVNGQGAVVDGTQEYFGE